MDKILKGAKPVDLPIQRPAFHVVVNLKTAQVLSLTIPATLLFQADGVIRRAATLAGAMLWLSLGWMDLGDLRPLQAEARH